MGGIDSNGVGANHIQQAGGTHTETLLVLIKQLHDHHNRYQRQQQRDIKQLGTDRQNGQQRSHQQMAAQRNRFNTGH